MYVELDKRVLSTRKDGWRDNIQKSKAVKYAIQTILNEYGISDDTETYRIFDLVKNQSDY